MKKAVRAIIIRGDELLVMHRNKFGKIYQTLPGGGVDPGETTLQALEREMAEETGMVFSEPRLVYVEDAGDIYGVQYVYLCQYVAGEPVLHPDSEEARINQLGQNIYTPQWIKLADIKNVPFVSDVLLDQLLNDLTSGFPATVIAIGG